MQRVVNYSYLFSFLTAIKHIMASRACDLANGMGREGPKLAITMRDRLFFFLKYLSFEGCITSIPKLNSLIFSYNSDWSTSYLITIQSEEFLWLSYEKPFSWLIIFLWLDDYHSAQEMRKTAAAEWDRENPERISLSDVSAAAVDEGTPHLWQISPDQPSVCNALWCTCHWWTFMLSNLFLLG